MEKTPIKTDFKFKKIDIQKYVEQEFNVPERIKPIDPVAGSETLIFEAQSIINTVQRRREVSMNTFNGGSISWKPSSNGRGDKK